MMENNNIDTDDLNDFFRMLKTETKLYILSVLKGKSMTAKEIGEDIILNQNNINAHIFELKKAGLIKAIKIGNKPSVYSIDRETIARIKRYFEGLMEVSE